MLTMTAEDIFNSFIILPHLEGMSGIKFPA